MDSWSKEKAIQVANKLKVSTIALSVALENAGLINNNDATLIKSAIIPLKDKNDPELHITLSLKSRKRREELIKLGLSSFYVGLCFDAYDEKRISSGRLCEMLLVSENELNDLAKLYGRYLHYDG